MSDLISREDAREAIEDLMDIHFDRQVVLAKARDAIVSLPSAEPKTGWIPVSERLPAEDGEYLVAYPMALGDAETEVDILNYGKPTMPNEKVRGRCWYDTDALNGDVIYDDIVAWMPLPEPYKGGEGE